MTTPTITINGVTFGACLCECGNAVSPNADYRPGHDARHAGNAARALAAHCVKIGEFPNWATAMEHEEMRKLPSGALKAKAYNHAYREYFRATRPKRGRTTNGTVKIGRWTYPARKLAGGKIERNDKTNGSGNWIEVTDDRHRAAFAPRA